MINNSIPEYLFIRTCIFVLRAIGPFSVAYSLLRPFVSLSPQWRIRLLPLDIYAAIEAAFLLFVYLPLKARSQHPTFHPPLRAQSERRTLFKRCIATTHEHEKYLGQWFRNADLADIKKENVEEFLAWAFLNTTSSKDRKQTGEPNVTDQVHEAELQDYIEGLERQFGRTLPNGCGEAKPLRLTLDEVRMVHRPLVWYLIIFLVDILTHFWLVSHQFNFYRVSLTASLASVFPPRPQSAFTRRVSTGSFPYWYRPHTSHKRRPIVFLHGIGVGLNTYVPFLAALNAHGNDEQIDGDIGIIALELLPVSFRITPSLPGREEFCAQLQKILDTHQEFANGFTLVAHSYGSVLATHMLSSDASSGLRPLIKSIVLIDPVSILLHLPDVAYNFTYRSPRSASQWQLWYFASTDMGVAHTLARGFFWSENILWKEDYGHLPITVFLADRDIIAPTHEIREYLTNCERSEAPRTWRGGWDEDHTIWRTDQGVGQPKTLVWCNGLDHAQIFDREHWRKMLVTEVERVSTIPSEEPTSSETYLG
ncbi:hypothetical protein EV356DRAFT_565957 [Viridothelium virens]|uniref:AB hydrolase-1 domain-containing protein n=1 Tax=Viridothelium virens TaxID=1048519 RepID=A0A6A6HCS2_VIRVR|nr:hypothetical protein EV356DRAFT_565957 [Viridothelium virens]